MITTQAHSVNLCGFVHSFVWYFLPSFRGTTDICTDSYISSATTSSLTLSLILLVPLISILTSQRKNKSYAHLPGTTQHVAHGHSACVREAPPWLQAIIGYSFAEWKLKSTNCSLRFYDHQLVAGFNPFEHKCARQIGNQSIFPQFCGVNTKKTFELAPSSRQVLLPFLIQAHSGPHTLASEKLNSFSKKRGLVNMEKTTPVPSISNLKKKLQ